MRLFKKEEEDFDDSAAFESDKYAIFKVFLMIIFGTGVVILIIWLGYDQFQKFSVNNNDSNQTIFNTTNVSSLPPGKIVVNFTTFNLTVTENPSGVYYYSAQEKVIGENCYINGIKKSCSSLTNSVCSEKECTKELVTKTECFVNSEKVECQ